MTVTAAVGAALIAALERARHRGATRRAKQGGATMKRLVSVLTMTALIVAAAAAPVLAQAQPAPRPAPGAPAADPRPKQVEGTVKKVDPAANTVQVSSGLLGIMGATLEVTGETQIQVEGKQGSLADIREGAKVKASYETRNGKNVAKSIDVMPAEAEKTGAPKAPAPKTQ
jgi:Cu/Ag efflux protein CusF